MPFYFKGVSSQCAQPAWVNLHGKAAGTVNLEVNDSFNRNSHPYHPRPTETTQTDGSCLNTIARTQSFTSWVAHRRPTGIRLLHEAKFTILVAVTAHPGGNGMVTVSNVSTCEADVNADRLPRADEALPRTAASSRRSHGGSAGGSNRGERHRSHRRAGRRVPPRAEAPGRVRGIPGERGISR